MTLREERMCINHDEVGQVTWQVVDMEIGMGIRNSIWDGLI